MSKTLKAWWRVVLVFGHIGGFVFICLSRNTIYGQNLNWTLRRRQRLVWKLLKVLRVELTTEGQPPEQNVVFIANHRSYLDPVVMHRDLLFLPVAKSEVGKWPIIGYGAKITGVLYVQRENKSSRKRTRQAIVETLKKGHSICIYPEGTTHIEPGTIDFRVGTFVVSAEHSLPIVPVAIIYADLADAWIGDDTFIPHLLKLCKKEKVEVRLVYGTPIQHSDPEQLLKQTRSWIDSQLLGEAYMAR